MNTLKNQNSMKYLEALYDSLVMSIKALGKNIINDSVLFTLMKMYSNDAFDIMLNSSIEISDSVQSDLEPLKEKEYIKLSELSSTRNKYLITTKGIYFIESYRYGFNVNKILEFVQEDKMDFKITKKPLTDKEKVIVMSLITLRSFNESSSMDLNDENRSNKWEEIINIKILPFLDNREIIDSQKVFSQSTGHEKPISYLMRRANDLPKKTSNMYKSLNDNRYYLNVDTSNKNLAIKQISFLLSKIFQKIKNIEDANKIKDFLCNVVQSQGLYLYDYFDFINFEWDKVINDAIDKVYLGFD